MEYEDFAKRIYYAFTADEQGTEHYIAKGFALLLQHLVDNGTLTREKAIEIVDETLR